MAEAVLGIVVLAQLAVIYRLSTRELPPLVKPAPPIRTTNAAKEALTKIEKHNIL